MFEDSGVDRLHPLTTARPAFSLTCGGNRLCDWTANLDENVVFSVRPYLRTLVEEDLGRDCGNVKTEFPWTILVNGRIVPSESNFSRLNNILQHFDAATVGMTQSVAVDQNQKWVVAAVPTRQLESAGALSALIEQTMPRNELIESELETLCFPHDVIRYNQKYFNENIDARIRRGEFREIGEGVFVDDSAQVDSSVVAKAREGPILIEAGAKIGPFCYLEGPLLIGRNCTVLEHAAIKEYVCLTDTVKVGGEVESTIIEPFSNKQHHGFLGHSYLGSWINIGAGTCNSDLKNTYGTVNVDYGHGKVSTDQQFVGCFLGDYSKTAINTSIFTGKSVGVCSMLYGFVTDNVPSFVNYAESFGQITEIPVEVMIKTQQRMFDRREIRPRSCDTELIRNMFELTQSERSGLNLDDQPPRF